MKKMLLTIGSFLVPIILASGASPIQMHPAAPSITITKAIEIAAKFAEVKTSATYCSSSVLVEGGMTPPPKGSVRHWHITFQDTGSDRTELRHVYVDMEGHVSDSIPLVSK